MEGHARRSAARPASSRLRRDPARELPSVARQGLYSPARLSHLQPKLIQLDSSRRLEVYDFSSGDS